MVKMYIYEAAVHSNDTDKQKSRSVVLDMNKKRGYTTNTVLTNDLSQAQL